MRITPTHDHSIRISIARLWPLTILVGTFVFLNTHPIRPHDFWWHMAAGREIVTTGRYPSGGRDFSFTAAGSPLSRLLVSIGWQRPTFYLILRPRWPGVDRVLSIV